MSSINAAKVTKVPLNTELRYSRVYGYLRSAVDGAIELLDGLTSLPAQEAAERLSDAVERIDEELGRES